MVGEVRDRETADIAIEAAMTGHLVLSTLHTIDAASAIGRLVDLGVEPRRFADALQLIIAQRLLRLNCSECAKPYRPKKSEWDAVGIDEEALGQDEWKPMKGTGCDVCRFTGFFGRMGLFEMLVPDEEIRDAIERKVNTSKIRHAAKAKGMKSLREQGLDRVKEGLTTLEEVIRVTA
jgi:type II secretory ATPase GspE/PulE/Tfp pilus assembly ATPase PilB-like protein